MVLAASRGSLKLGTPIVLETDEGRPWQEWSLRKNEDGSYGLLPRHCPGKGLDHLGGDPRPGAKINIWTDTPGDRHLAWFIRPPGPSFPRPASRLRAPTFRPRSSRKTFSQAR